MDMYPQWLQSSQIMPESSQHVQHEPRASSSTTLDDWTKDRSMSIPQTGSVASAGSPTSPSSGIDLGDFTTLGDMAGPSSASALLSASPQAFYAQYQPNYFMPFQTMAYGAPWSTSNPVPVSNYSTLNGATTSSATASSSQQQNLQQTQPQQQQSHQQQQHSPPSQQMIIDPALTTLTSMNGSGSNGMQQQFSQASTYNQQASQQAQRTQYPSFPQHINPYTSHYYRQQQSSASQGTLSPHALHSSTNALPPSSFYTPPVAAPTPPSAPQGPTPEERKQQFQNSIRPLLQSSAFTGAQAVNTLVERIAKLEMALAITTFVLGVKTAWRST